MENLLSINMVARQRWVMRIKPYFSIRFWMSAKESSLNTDPETTRITITPRILNCFKQTDINVFQENKNIFCWISNLEEASSLVMINILCICLITWIFQHITSFLKFVYRNILIMGYMTHNNFICFFHIDNETHFYRRGSGAFSKCLE